MNPDGEIKSLVNCIRDINRKGWSEATSTNYSLRIEDKILISKSGIDKSEFNAGHLMEIDAEGEPLPGYENDRPSAETAIHLFIYQKTNAKAILHTHSVYSTILSLRFQNQGEINISGFEMQKALPEIDSHEQQISIPVYPNEQDMRRFTGHLNSRFLPKIPAFLIGGHGLYAWGSSVSEAKKHLEAVEFLLECFVRINE